MSSDPSPDDDWLGIRLTGWSSPVSTSSVRTHPAGKLAIDSFAEALTKCSSNEAIVIFSAWSFNNVPTSSGYTDDLFRAAAQKGARIRGLFAKFQTLAFPGGWRFAPGDTPDNRGNVEFFNRLPNGAAILDGWALHRIFPIWSEFARVQVGIHHMKAWVVYDGSRLRAWIGGVDLNNNRTPDQGPNYWHDVQAEMEGPAAYHVYGLLRSRWNDHPSVASSTLLPLTSSQVSDAGQQRARIVTTFGNPAAYAGLGPPGQVRWNQPKVKRYPFAPTGSKSYREIVSHCITKAQRFIYVEDQ